VHTCFYFEHDHIPPAQTGNGLGYFFGLSRRPALVRVLPADGQRGGKGTADPGRALNVAMRLPRQGPVLYVREMRCRLQVQGPFF
jgi:hypothetical protein